MMKAMVHNKEHAEVITKLDSDLSRWARHAKILEGRLKIAQGKRDIAEVRLWGTAQNLVPAIKTWPGFTWDPETSTMTRDTP